MPVLFARIAASLCSRAVAAAVLAFAPATRARAMKHSVRSGPDGIASQVCALASAGAPVTAAATRTRPISNPIGVGALQFMQLTLCNRQVVRSPLWIVGTEG